MSEGGWRGGGLAASGSMRPLHGDWRAGGLALAALLAAQPTVAAWAQTTQAATSVPSGSPLDSDLGTYGVGSGAIDTMRLRRSDMVMPQATGESQQSPQWHPDSIGSASLRSYGRDELLRAEPGLDAARRMKAPPKPGEFEDFVQTLVGRKLERYGADLLLPSSREFALPATATVPPDYLINVGDVIAISLKGSIEGSVERRVDSSGNIVLAQVGPVHLAGVRFADVKDRISAAIGTSYRDYGVAVELKDMAGVRVYVTGFANNPGQFTVNSLSTMASAVFQAGGPTAGGSFRRIVLYRDGRVAGELDLYDLLRGGNRVGDAVLRNEDVLFIPPAGEQVAVIGSVQHEAIYEMKPGETVEQALAVAGGPNTLADGSRLILYRNVPGTPPGPHEVSRQAAATMAVEPADILQVLSGASLVQPMDRQSVVVRIEGEVAHPGNYFVAPGTPMEQVLAMAGGLTARAFPFGARFERQSVRQQQRQGFEEAVDQLELTIASAPLTADGMGSSDRSTAELASARAVLDKLREAQPDGRVVLDIGPLDSALPGAIQLENNDRIYIPPRATTVGVFGAVYRPSSFLISGEPVRVKDYIQQAGGPQRAADLSHAFVVRANGQVLTRKAGGMDERALPGDVIFVPVKTSNSSFWSKLRDISTVVFQLGITGAAVAALAN